VSEARTVDVVVPSHGRPTLGSLLDALAAQRASLPGRVIVVDDRRPRARHGPLVGAAAGAGVEEMRGPGRGPAAARNAGWRASAAEWVAFLDDDVVPEPGWAEALAADVRGAGPDAAGVQGRLSVPLPAGRRPTDWERQVAGLATAQWATADLTYRRSVLEAVGGFDERFGRAYREDADLGLRVSATGRRIVAGTRRAVHPVPAVGPWVSVGRQAGNADDVLMVALHGREWRRAAGAPPGRLSRHGAVTAAGVAALAGALTRHPRVARGCAAAWLAGTAEFAWARIAPGPRSPREVAAMTATSVLIPPVAVAHRLAGTVARARLLADHARAPTPAPGPIGAPSAAPDAVLLDRDGTLIVDVPYNDDPEQVVPVAGAREALERLRAAGVPLGVVSNQSGVARGLVSPEALAAVNARVEELLGPLGPWAVCPHGPDEGCACRKPEPGLVLEAAGRLGVEPSRCAVVGDIGADVEAARAAGARGVLVPNERTRPEEIRAAAEVAPDLGSAVELLLTRAAA